MQRRVPQIDRTSDNFEMASQMCESPLTPRRLLRITRLRHGKLRTAGWSVRLRRRYGYFQPRTYYEALIDHLITTQTDWLDVGCGRDLVPDNHRLGKILSRRCNYLHGVDPSSNVYSNEFIHEGTCCPIEDFRSDRTFDLITLRMVAEHIVNPEALLQSLSRLTKPGGLVVVYTVNKWTPAAIVAALTPMAFHHWAKKVLWNTEEVDTFEVAYRMNTRSTLKRLFGKQHFKETHFWYLADCSVTGRWRLLNTLEIGLCKALAALKVVYPENCLLGVYRRLDDGRLSPPTA